MVAGDPEDRESGGHDEDNLGVNDGHETDPNYRSGWILAGGLCRLANNAHSFALSEENIFVVSGQMCRRKIQRSTIS